MKTVSHLHNAAVMVNTFSLTDVFMFILKEVCVGGGDRVGRAVALQKY